MPASEEPTIGATPRTVRLEDDRPSQPRAPAPTDVGYEDTVIGSEDTVIGSDDTVASGDGLPGRQKTEGLDTDGLDDPKEIGRFVVEKRLGAGGMGVVYLARDPDLDRPVAIKLLRGRSSNDTRDRMARDRLVREAKAMARVVHPNLVTVYEVGQQAGQVYIAMEYIQGQTLTDWAQTVVEPDARLEACVAAGKGLAAAHAAGLIHRDFKPDNVMVSEDGRVVVLDFGLARELDGDEDETFRNDEEVDPVTTMVERLTRTGAIMGTPAYMPPEQLSGGIVDARADQFSFCITTFQIVWGERPFQGDSIAALVTDVLSGKPRLPEVETPLESRVVTALRPGLSVSPDDRYTDLDELLEALATSMRAPEDRPRSRLLWAVGTIGLASVVAIVLALRGDAPAPPAATETEPGLEAPASAETKSPEAKALEEKAMIAYEAGAEAYSQGRYQEALDHYLDAQSAFPSPDFHYNIGQCHEALDHFDRAIESYRAYLRSDPKDAPNVQHKIERLQAQLDAAAREADEIVGDALAAAAAAEAEEAPAADAGQPKDRSKTKDKSKDKTGRRGALAKKAKACGKSQGALPGTQIRVELQIDGSGSVSKARVLPPDAGSRVGNCVEKALEGQSAGTRDAGKTVRKTYTM